MLDTPCTCLVACTVLHCTPSHPHRPPAAAFFLAQPYRVYRLQVACNFGCADKVLTVAMSNCATSHALIAVGDKQQGLVLADIASGAFTHTLDGHRCVNNILFRGWKRRWIVPIVLFGMLQLAFGQAS